MKYKFVFFPGYSAYDHFAKEIILRATTEKRTTKTGMENALRHAWATIRPHTATGPRIDVTR